MRLALSIAALAIGTALAAQELDRAEGRVVQQFARTMKPGGSKNQVEFFVSEDKNYIVELEVTGFRPLLKVLKVEKKNQNVLATGKKFDAKTWRAELITPPVGTLVIQVNGEEANPTGTYKLTVLELPKKK